MFIDTLESRTLRTATVEQVGTELHVTGTEESETITIWEEGGSVLTQQFDAATGDPIVTEHAGITRVKVDLGGGDDYPSFYGKTVGADVRVSAGHDSVEIDDVIPDPGTIILGNAGAFVPSAVTIDDGASAYVWVYHGNGTTIYGGDGDDAVFGALYGGHVHAFMGAGDDTVMLVGEGSTADMGDGYDVVVIDLFSGASISDVHDVEEVWT